MSLVENSEKRLFSIISLNPYNTFTSVSTIINLLKSTENEITKVILCGDDIDLNPKLWEYFELKNKVNVELFPIPKINDFLTSKNSFNFGIKDDDLVDIRPGSNIHSAFILNEINSKNISPTLLIPSSRGDRINIAKTDLNGYKASKSLPFVSKGDLHALMLSLCHEDESYEKQII